MLILRGLYIAMSGGLMFNEMCCEAKRIQKTPSNRMRLFWGKQKTSLRKRFYSVKIAFLKNKH